MRRLLVERTPAASSFTGRAWLFLGVYNTDSILYQDEWTELQHRQPEKFHVHYAFSQEEKNRQGGDMYVQHRVEEHIDEIMLRMANGAHIYFCGVKGMMIGILGIFEQACVRKGLVWSEVLQTWKQAKQWHVEVY